MTSISFVTLDVADVAAAETFYAAAFNLGGRVKLRASDVPSTGFRGFTLSLTVPQPGNADAILDAAIAAGATVLKPAAKSLWGYGGVIQAPDGTIWKIATAKKKDSATVTQQFDEMVLLIGATDVAATKKYYVENGLAVAKSYGRTYVQFATPGSPIQLGLYGHRALAKDAGVDDEGTGSHRITVNSDAGTLSDPDGFAWEPMTV